MEYCRVIVDGAPFVNEDGFTYRVPPSLEQFVAIGSIVYVPFGKGDKLKIGFVVSEEAAVETEALIRSRTSSWSTIFRRWSRRS